MNKISFLLLLFLASCTTAPIKTEAPLPVPSDHPQLAAGKITALVEEIPMVTEGFKNANLVLYSSCFKDKVLAADFTETNNLSNKQIYELSTTTNIKVDVEIFTGTWYQSHVLHTVGYEIESSKIYMNRYFVTNAYLVGDNLIHEIAHSLGFSHYKIKSTSVPYQFNDFYEACADKVGIK